MVTDEAGVVLFIVRLLQTADTPASILGILEIPGALEMTTSVADVGTPVHQLPATLQSLLVPPIQPPAEGNTVTLVAADLLVQGVLEVTCSMYQVV
jgi:hypothetical protein